MMKMRLFCFLLGVFIFLTPQVFAQSGSDFSAWKDWCVSIGGTHNNDPNNPVCTPGSGNTSSSQGSSGQSYTPPSLYQPDYQAQERARAHALERVRKEKERQQQEAAISAAEETARQSEFLKERDAAISELKGLDTTTSSVPKLKGLDDNDVCPPSQDSSVVDLCSRDGKPKGLKPIEKNSNSEIARIIGQMNAYAKKSGWTEAELSRLDTALNKLDSDGINSSKDTIREVWKSILNRKDNDLVQAAAAGKGPGFPGAGQQTIYQDCAVFALANAAGLPYSVVATQASELLSQAEWRKKSERTNTEKVFKNGGLNGGEVLILAESLGQGEVIKRADFADTLKSGRPIMINVIPPDGDGAHEVVLTKTFQHDGKTWYEMMDSNQGPLQRIYLDRFELSLILQENGVAFRPEPGTTPKLLRNN